MKLLLVISFFFFFVSCNNQQLSEEQRKEVKEQLKTREPVIIKDEALISRTFEVAHRSWKDTANSSLEWKIYYNTPENPLHAELWEAYSYSATEGIPLDDNVQLTDTIIYYSRPLIESGDFKGIAILPVPKKEIVLLITKENQ